MVAFLEPEEKGRKIHYNFRAGVSHFGHISSQAGIKVMIIKNKALKCKQYERFVERDKKIKNQ